MDISNKSIGVLIDELITTDLKIWFAQEEVCSGFDDALVAKAGKDSQTLNARRNALIRAIDDRLGEGNITPTSKTYK